MGVTKKPPKKKPQKTTKITLADVIFGIEIVRKNLVHLNERIGSFSCGAIHKSVGNKLSSLIQEKFNQGIKVHIDWEPILEEASGRALKKMIQRVGDEAINQMEQARVACENSLRSFDQHCIGLSNRIAEMFNKNAKTTIEFCEHLKAEQEAIIAGIRKGNVQSLKQIVGEEITKSQFDELIRQEVRTVVRQALKPTEANGCL